MVCVCARANVCLGNALPQPGFHGYHDNPFGPYGMPHFGPQGPGNWHTNMGGINFGFGFFPFGMQFVRLCAVVIVSCVVCRVVDRTNLSTVDPRRLGVRSGTRITWGRNVRSRHRR